MAANVLLMPQYLQHPVRFRPARAATFVLIGLVHVAAIGSLFIHRSAPVPPQPQAMMVTFISDTPKPPEPEPPPPPPEPVKPKPLPKMAATTRPTPSAIEAPPIEEEEPVQEEPPPPPTASEPGPVEPPVIPPNFIAAYLNNPAPAYPQMSIRLREEGTVLLLVLVNAGGTADEVRVEKSSGYSRLDSAAVDVVKKRWRFVAAKQGDQAVAAWVKIPLSFELKKN